MLCSCVYLYIMPLEVLLSELELGLHNELSGSMNSAAIHKHHNFSTLLLPCFEGCTTTKTNITEPVVIQDVSTTSPVKFIVIRFECQKYGAANDQKIDDTASIHRAVHSP